MGSLHGVIFQIQQISGTRQDQGLGFDRCDLAFRTNRPASLLLPVIRTAELLPYRWP